MVNRLYARNQKRAENHSSVKRGNLLVTVAILQSSWSKFSPRVPNEDTFKDSFSFSVSFFVAAFSHAKLNYYKFPLKCDVCCIAPASRKFRPHFQSRWHAWNTAAQIMSEITTVTTCTRNIDTLRGAKLPYLTRKHLELRIIYFRTQMRTNLFSLEAQQSYILVDLYCEDKTRSSKIFLNISKKDAIKSIENNLYFGIFLLRTFKTFVKFIILCRFNFYENIYQFLIIIINISLFDHLL